MIPSRNDYQQLALRIYSAAMAVKQLTPPNKLQEVVDKGLEDGNSQYPDPRQVMTRLVWEHLLHNNLLLELLGHSTTMIMEHWANRITQEHGHCGAQSHSWIEFAHPDEGDPNLRRYIIDVAPVGVAAPGLLIEPDSPFQMLYGGRHGS